MPYKSCTSCKRVLAEKFFYVQKQTGKNGEVWLYKDSMCKTCRSDYTSQRRKDLKSKIVEYLGGRCKHCGLVDDPAVYDCHHLDPAEKEVSIANATNRSFESLRPELDKCILLCANCHRKEHS